jgi:GrpB-like predicted nucleotidyltransferase (UPF0157 family)
MKIQFERYNAKWKQSFEEIKNDLINIIDFVNPIIEHIGSTSVAGLSAKPIIDVMIGLNCEDDLDKIVKPLMDKEYIYYEKYNEVLPYRRFFVKLNPNPKSLSLPIRIGKEDEIPIELKEHWHRLAHIQALEHNSRHWIRHIAFRDYLRAHPDIKEEYQHLKEELSKLEWMDGNEYNAAKDTFIKTEERKAKEWFEKGNRL